MAIYQTFDARRVLAERWGKRELTIVADILRAIDRPPDIPLPRDVVRTVRGTSTKEVRP